MLSLGRNCADSKSVFNRELLKFLVQNVKINMYNVRGQCVRALLDGSTEFETGYLDVVWNGRDDCGRQVGSGVYLYRF